MDLRYDRISAIRQPPADMKIAIVCFPGFGGSGVVASELAAALARSGDEIHVLSSDRPVRLSEHRRVTFHPVEAEEYPLFRSSPYTLALANSLACVAEHHQIDLVHVHYAVPHASSAVLARSLLAPRPLPIVTTLHGTDVTRVGSSPSYARTTQFAIEQSDAVTAVSEALKSQAQARLGIRRSIEVVPNFVIPGLDLPHFEVNHEPQIVHISNFRPVKRSLDVIEIFARVRNNHGLRLLMIGDGPDRLAAGKRCEELGLSDRVHFEPPRARIEELLCPGDIFLLPSEEESFGLAGLEAQACGMPVVASRVGGLPEVICDQETGYLCEPGDLDSMAAAVDRLLEDPELRIEMGRAAGRHAQEEFHVDRALDGYRRVYQQVLEPARV